MASLRRVVGILHIVVSRHSRQSSGDKRDSTRLAHKADTKPVESPSGGT